MTRNLINMLAELWQLRQANGSNPTFPEMLYDLEFDLGGKFVTTCTDGELAEAIERGLRFHSAKAKHPTQ